jgi:hypothetical protein
MMEDKNEQLGLGFGPGSKGERQEALRQAFDLCMGMWKLLKAEASEDTERKQLVIFSMLVFNAAIPCLNGEIGISEFMRPFLFGRMPDEEMVERRFIDLVGALSNSVLDGLKASDAGDRVSLWKSIAHVSFLAGMSVTGTDKQRMIDSYLADNEDAKRKLSEYGKLGGEKRSILHRQLKAWTIERYWTLEKEYQKKNGKSRWKSANQAARYLCPEVLKQGTELGVTLMESNAEMTIARWINESKKCVKPA